MVLLTKKKALKLLEAEGCDKELVRHCIAVSKEARKIAEKLKKKGYKTDVDFVETAALLHDIGRSRTHGIMHGIEGARILKKYPAYARVCERHIGAGLTKADAASLGLPPKDYLPKTLEEKVIAHADNIISGDCVVSIKDTLRKMMSRLGSGSPALKRMRDLNNYLEGLMK